MLSDIGIPEMLLGVVCCQGYIQEDNPVVILTCNIKLISYYLTNGFVIIENYSLSMNKISIRFKNAYMPLVFMKTIL